MQKTSQRRGFLQCSAVAAVERPSTAPQAASNAPNSEVLIGVFLLFIMQPPFYFWHEDVPEFVSELCWAGACAFCTFTHGEPARRRGAHSSLQLLIRLQHGRQDGSQVRILIGHFGDLVLATFSVECLTLLNPPASIWGCLQCPFLTANVTAGWRTRIRLGPQRSQRPQCCGILHGWASNGTRVGTR